MEDYIFLIIAIVLSIFGVINQSKKKNIAANRIIEEKEEPRNQFMDEFDDDFLNEPEVTIAPPVQKKPIQVNVANKSTIDIPRGKFYHQSFKSTLPDRPKHERLQTTWKQKEDDEIGEADESMNYLEDFSLRKAFVYSEILNRKY